MRAIVLTAYGGLDGFREETWPLPLLRPHEVRVRIRAAAFNPVDGYWRRGQHAPPLPVVLGRDVAGEVDAVGEAVTAYRPGDRVFGYIGGGRGSNGAYATHVSVPAAMLAPMPQGWDFRQAASLPVVGLTALLAVRDKQPLRRGEPVFVAGGSGMVGFMAVQLLRAEGAGPVLATVGNPAIVERMRGWGMPSEWLLDHRSLKHETLRERILAVSGGGLRLAYDFVGGAMKRLGFEVLGPEGHLISAVEEPPDFSINLWDESTSPLVLGSRSFHFVQLGARGLYGRDADLAWYGEGLRALARMIEEGRLELPPQRCVGELSLAAVREAHALLDASKAGGKLVMDVP
jgi:NADPH2:quinone reductase